MGVDQEDRSQEVLMKRNSNLTVLGCLLLLISCGKGIGEKNSAPRSQNEAGIIASCTSKAQAEQLSAKLGISFRVINEKRKIIEYIGISMDELKKHLPRSNFKVNKVFNEVLVEGDFNIQSYGDYPYYGAHSIQGRPSNPGRYFSHLDQVNADRADNQGEAAVIAVIDTGVYYNHPHLSPNIKTNSNDPHGSNEDGRDNDGNGFADDYVGWDFYNGDAYPLDDHGHGTHVAGLAASTVSGIAPQAKILPIKVLGADGRGDLGTIAAGILYAIDQGADIINMSLGGEGGSQINDEIRSMINSVKLAKEKDVLVIAAAGNGGSDGLGDCNDNAPVYPANINQDNVISVAAVDSYNGLTSYSNFGGATVDIAAPGGDSYSGGLLSAAIPNCYGPCDQSEAPYVSQMGTSMATPLVSGLAALVKTKFPDYNYKQIKEKIMNGGVKLEDLAGLIRSESVIDVGLTLSN